MNEEHSSGRDTQISRQVEDKRREAGQKKETLLDELDQLRDLLTLREDLKFIRLQKIWAKDKSQHQRVMLTEHDTNKVFSSRGFFGAYTLVLDWENDVKSRIKSINSSIVECDNVLNPTETENFDKGQMDMTDNKPAG